MAVDINSLVRTIGGQEKVIDKDKALLELANAIENGGGGQPKKIVSCWKAAGVNEFEKIDILDNVVSITDGSYGFTTDENEPNLDLTNVALLLTITEGIPTFGGNGIIFKYNIGIILLFENMDDYKNEDSYLSIEFDGEE